MKFPLKFLALLLALLLLPLSIAGAIEPHEIMDDPALETRARALSKELRCPVCQNQSLDDSDADIAKDLRRMVRERLIAGDDDPQIKAHLVARYGNFVLLKPPVAPMTWILWFGPLGVILIGGVVVWRIARRNRQQMMDTRETETSDG
ncbi:MAG: cytochrome c-type biogenesis protein [Alphaproteobacteria bacterium]|jgi:cytochrome c-type biogenesis protein CcmH